MEYKRFENTIIARIDKGEELTEKIREIAIEENVKLASVSGLGATDDFTVGCYNLAEKKYHSDRFTGDFEIVSLTGTINTMKGEYYSHLHLSAGNAKGEVFGGHLNSAVISVTGEIVINVINGRTDRKYCEECGINKLDFS